MSPPPVEVLIELFAQAALYGLYISTLVHCLRWLVYTDDGWKLRDRVNKLMLITAILIFFLSSVNLFILLPVQLDLLGAFGDTLNVAAVGVISVCKCHGWHSEPKK